MARIRQIEVVEIGLHSRCRSLGMRICGAYPRCRNPSCLTIEAVRLVDRITAFLDMVVPSIQPFRMGSSI